MTDIYFGLALIGGLSALLFFWALTLSRQVPRPYIDGLAVLTVAGLLLYTRFLWDSLLLCQWLPFSNLIVVGNWFPLSAAFLAGLAWQRVPGRIVRKALSVTALMGAASFSAVYPLLGAAPDCGKSWLGDVCLQTSSQTCSPASAATLLRAYGIAATEQEMADLCLTRGGTTWPGLYHGLKAKTEGTIWDVQAFEWTVDDLRSRTDPAILSVGLEKGGRFDPAYEREWGWTPGVAHTVVYFRYWNAHRIDMADPSVGRELWSEDDLRLLWRGRGMRLVRR